MSRDRSMAVRTDVGSTKRRSVRTTPQPLPLPTDFICIDPEEAAQLFKYLNRTDEAVDKAASAAHLGLCFHCQEEVLRMKKKIDNALLEELLI